MPAPPRRRPTRSPPPAPRAAALLILLLAAVAATAAAASSRTAAAFLGPARLAPQQRATATRAAASSSSSNGGDSLKRKQQRLVVDPEDLQAAPSFDSLLARAQDAALKQELSAPPSLLPPRAPTAAEDREVLEELTGLLYHALNERSTETMARLWLEDDPSVVFFAGDDAGPVCGYAAVVDMLRLVRQEERRLDPGKSKGPLMLHPPVEASNFRVVINGMHAWVTCKETMSRGLTKDHPFDPKADFWTGTNLFRRFNGQWRLVMHWSGRLAPVAEQLTEMLEQKKQKEMAKQQGGGGAGRGGAGGSKGMGRMPFRPEDLGLPPGMSLDGAEAEITWELDEEDLAEMEFQEGEEGEWEFDPETGTMAFSRGGFINEDGTVTWTTPSGEVVGTGAEEGAMGVGGLLDSWHRTAVFREKTKKALGAVRRLAREGRITKLEKAKLIHSVITSTSHDEISQVEMAYDLLVKRGVGDLEEFADQCKAISADYAWGYP